MHWAPIVLVIVTLAARHNCQPPDTIEFNADTLGQTVNVQQSSLIQLQDNCIEGTCKKFNGCESGMYSTDNGIVTFSRENLGRCSDPLYRCCVEDSEPLPPAPPPNTNGCGIRNADGIVVSITGATEGESNFGEFPWMVILLIKIDDNYSFKCGGSLIHHQVVLTTSHCVINETKDTLTVRAGEWESQSTTEISPHQERSVKRIITHKDYRHYNAQNNIALLVLESPFSPASHIDVICLPEQAQHFANGRCVATGWGKETFNNPTKFVNILKSIELPIMPSEQCTRKFRTTRLGPRFSLHRSYICAGGEEGKDTCKGDGGGPLVCPMTRDSQERYVQAGITAWGIGCGEQGVPGAYTSVSFFRNWIDQMMIAEGFDTISYTIPSN